MTKRPEMRLVATNETEEEARAWLENCVARGAKKHFSEVHIISPMRANLLLENNPKNRRYDNAHTRKLANSIRTGKYELNGETIIVAVDGYLNNGQHRCSAIVQAGRSIESFIAFGLPRESRFTVDQGKVRSAGDYLHMQGYEYAAQIAAITSLISSYLSTGNLPSGGHSRPAQTEILEMVKRDRENIMHSFHAVNKPKVNHLVSKPIIAFCHWLISRKVPIEAVDEFMDKVISGSDLKSNSPILYCRERLVEMKAKKKAICKVEMIIKTWNLWRTGKPTYRIPTLGKEIPEIET